MAQKKEYPVSKVVGILEDMRGELEHEASQDDDINKKMQCWCKTAKEEKGAAIKDANELIPVLEAKITARTDESERLAGEISETKDHIEKSKTSLKEATEDHAKKMDESKAKETEMSNYLKALKKAERKIAKTLEQGKPLFLEKGSSSFSALQEAADLVKQIQEKNGDKFVGVISPHQQSALLAISQTPEAPKLKDGATHAGDTNAIMGVLGEMKITFTKDLQFHAEEEAAAKKEFEDLSAAKNEEIAASNEAVISKKSQKANAEEIAATTTSNKEGVQRDLDANKKMLADATEQCEVHDKTYLERQATRNEEQIAVSKAIEILGTDDARELFTRTFNQGASFLQIEEHKDSRRLNKAVNSLVIAAEKVGDKHMVAFAKSLKMQSGATLDAFEQVIEALDKLYDEIGAKSKAEVEKKDSCNDRFTSNTVDVERYTRDKSDANTLKTSMVNAIAETDKQIADAQDAIKNLKKALADAQEDKNKETAEFDKAVAEQTQTQELLTQAIDVLDAEYNKEAALVQTKTKEEPAKEVDENGPGAAALADPTSFKSMSPNRKSGSVIGMLKVIRQDAAALEKAARVAEEEAIKDFDQFKADTEAEVEAKTEHVVDLNESRANSNEKRQGAEDDITAIVGTLGSLADTKTALEEECNFLLKNFDVRQEAMTQERAALTQAKAILKGDGVQADLAKEAKKA
eukprot:TRINITY_DN94004_c0_g1_i1.p1 TRINITY_DN94004_c0_g1~~TRINITY_DN94004_c0_g1_i1.p1  ORF type:complete len:741 (-),score=281.22 TRINITY_DN94004_c0_g1_i1:114-2189(-)